MNWQRYADKEFAERGLVAALENDARLAERVHLGEIVPPKPVRVRYWAKDKSTGEQFEVDYGWKPRHRDYGSAGYTVELL